MHKHYELVWKTQIPLTLIWSKGLNKEIDIASDLVKQHHLTIKNAKPIRSMKQVSYLVLCLNLKVK